MTEEEYFRKTYPGSCYGDKPLSPYWDFFQDGVEFGERQSKKKIEELENKIADIKANCDLAIEGRDIKIKELEKENADLKRDKEDLIFVRNAKADHINELKEELKKWKDEWQEQVQKAIDEGYARTQQTIQLTKAKELLAKWVELFKPKLKGYPRTPIQEQTEQFLKEIEK